MKKAKSLLAVAAVATAITCAVGMTACSNNDNKTENSGNDSRIEAVYQLYTANAQANGETALTYEQWLESIKGPQGATGATGKSAYEIAKENGFSGTEAEWLESLKGADGSNGANGTNGTDGKSAYEIAQDNGFTGTEAEWLASLKGEKGEDGSASTSPCVDGIYNTSDGLVIKFTDGTVKPVQDGGVTNPLMQVGNNVLEIPFEEGDIKVGIPYDLFLLEDGKYEVRICYDLSAEYNYYDLNVVGDWDSVNTGFDPYTEEQAGGTPSGTWSDGTEYWSFQLDVVGGFVNTFRFVNYSQDNTTTFNVEIVKVVE